MFEVWIKAGLVPISTLVCLSLCFSFVVPRQHGQVMWNLCLCGLPIAIKHCLPTANTTERKIWKSQLAFLGGPASQKWGKCKLWLPNFERPTRCTGHSTKVRRRRYVAKRVGVRGAALRPSKRDISLFLNQLNLIFFHRVRRPYILFRILFSHSWRPQRWNLNSLGSTETWWLNVDFCEGAGMLHATVVGVIEYLFWNLKASTNVWCLNKGWACSNFDSSLSFLRFPWQLWEAL